MLISKNLSKQLDEVFAYNITPRFISAGNVPSWCFNLKGEKFSENIFYITVPFIDATENFIKEHNETTFDWALSSGNFKVCFIVPIYKLHFRIFLVEKKNSTVFVGQFMPTKHNNSYVGSISVFDLLTDGSIRSYCYPINLDKKLAIPLIDAHATCINYMVFMHYAEVKEKIIPGSTKNKGVCKEKRDINLSNYNIKRIDSWLFTKVTRENPFDVVGHRRLQRYGPGLSLCRSIYIKPFTKKGYTRRAGLEIAES